MILGYNVERTLEVTYNSIPREWVDDIILINNASADRTGEIAKTLGIKTFTNARNMGYGGAQKRGYNEALKMGADAVVMVGEHFPDDDRKLRVGARFERVSFRFSRLQPEIFRDGPS